MEGSEVNPSKRYAQVGQWRTPPAPYFPSQQQQQQQQQQEQQQQQQQQMLQQHYQMGLHGQNQTGMPAGDMEHEMALRAAYRRGAEAAAGMSSSAVSSHGVGPVAGSGGGGGGGGIGSVVSCPDLGAAHVHAADLGPIGEEPDPQLVDADADALGMGMGPAGIVGAEYSVPVAAPLPLGPLRVPSHHPQPHQVHHQVHSHVQHQVQQGQPLHQMPQAQMQHQAQAQARGQPPHSHHHAQEDQMQALVQPRARQGTGARRGGAAARSVSLPDISSYAAQADAEEAKRRKRLARNRASARLRRLRKKNLVDSYEGEVRALEASLEKLKSHSWGVGADASDLLEALSMDRGQQHVDAAKRIELVASILAQQREHIQNVRECQLETCVLGWVAGRGSSSSGGGGDGAGGEETKEGGGSPPAVKAEEQRGSPAPSGPVATAEEEAELARELEELLCLTDEQRAGLLKANEGAEEDRRAVDTLDACLEAIEANSWLLNEGVEEVTDRFMSILNPAQTSKFLLWTDHNAEAIDQLDYVRAPPADAPPASGPMFYFGVEEGGDIGEA